MSPLTATVTRPVSLDTAVLVIDEFASSTSLNKFDRSIALSAASSATVTSDKAFATTGGSSTPVTVTVIVCVSASVPSLTFTATTYALLPAKDPFAS